MNSGAHQQVAPKIKRSMMTVRLFASGVLIIFAKYEVLPFYSALIVAGILSIETTMKMSETKSQIGQNFLNFCLSTSPLWMLYLDSCQMVFAQVLSVTNARNLVLEENKKNYKIFYWLLTLTSWLIIICFGRSLLEECPVKMADNFKNDAIIIFFALLIFNAALTRQANSILSELKESLTAVKELNSKLEGLNEELKQSLKDKDNFILLFSHETRNPLNILIGNLTLLIGEIGDAQYKMKLERCKFCADLLLQQLTNILDSGKLSSNGKLELSPVSVNLQEYIQSISSFMEMLVKKKGTVRSELIIPESLPVTLKFDMQRFTQVCLNLLTNGLKFTDSGFLSLVVRYIHKDSLQEPDYYPSSDFGYRLLCAAVRRNIPSNQDISDVGEENVLSTQIGYKRQFTREIANLGTKKKTFTGVEVPEKGFLKIEINDTGCGIKPEDANKLFKKFSQTHSDTAQLQVGSGLGLWITKTLCEIMGGDVKAYSVPNVGSCFVAIIQADCLPSNRLMRFATSPRSPLLQRTVSSNKQEVRRILLVDDDPFNLEFHTQIIKSLGYNAIETAIDGQTLVEQFKKRPEGYFEAIITDIAMPNLDGIGAAKLVRKFEEDERRITRVKIGFITGHSNHTDKMICEKSPLNCLFYLSKPINAAILESFLPSLRRNSFISLGDQEPKSPIKLLHSARFANTANLTRQLSRLSSPLILCVDDDIFNLDFLEEMLKSLGARTLRVQSGEESIKLMKSAVLKNVKEDIPQLVLIDCRMRKMDGWKASKLMKEMLRKEFGTSTTIIGISGDDKDHNHEYFQHSGMNEVIQKPIQKKELQRLLDKYT